MTPPSSGGGGGVSTYVAPTPTVDPAVAAAAAAKALADAKAAEEKAIADAKALAEKLGIPLVETDILMTDETYENMCKGEPGVEVEITRVAGAVLILNMLYLIVVKKVPKFIIYLEIIYVIFFIFRLFGTLHL